MVSDNQHIKYYIIISVLLTLLLWTLSTIFGCTPVQAAVDTTKAVIHHTESPCWTTVEDIDKWHKERGWDGIGYHAVIYCDGSVHDGRDLSKQGAHARGRNDRIGIALVGTDSFTDKQINALRALLKQYKVQSVERHHEKCPGEGINVEGLL